VVPWGPKSAIGPALVAPVMAAPSAMVMVVACPSAFGGIWICVPARFGSWAAVTVRVPPALVTSWLTTYLLPTSLVAALQPAAA
jgi:hypothetical protein